MFYGDGTTDRKESGIAYHKAVREMQEGCLADSMDQNLFDPLDRQSNQLNNPPWGWDL